MKAALQYYANNTSQLASNHIQACYYAIQELSAEVVQVLKNQTVTVGAGNIYSQQAAASDAGQTFIDSQVVTLFNLVADIILNYTSFDGTTAITSPSGAAQNTYTLTYPTTSVVNAGALLYNNIQPYGAWNIITNASATITSYVYNLSLIHI